MKFSLLRTERRRRGWSQATVAEALGVTTRTVMRWEQGQVAPHPYYREPLCNLFDKTAEELGFLSNTNENAILEDTQPTMSDIPTQQISEQLISSLVEREQAHEQEAHTPADHILLPQSPSNVDIHYQRNISAFSPFNRFSWHALHIPSKSSLPITIIFIVLLFFILQPLIRNVQATNTTITQISPLTAPVASRLSTNYEAEAGGNILAGGAKMFDCSVCSGGKRVGDIGRNGTLQFNNIREKSPDTYTLTIHYIYGGSSRRPLYIDVNNTPASVVTVLGMGNWNVVATFSVMISLNAGNNTIKLYNPGHSAPDIDRIVVDKS